VEIVAAANYCHQLAPSWGLAPIMRFISTGRRQAADTVLREIGGNPDAVLAVDDSGVELAALLSERLGLPGNPAHAVRRVRDKLAFRRPAPGNGNSCVLNSIICRPERPPETVSRVEVSCSGEGTAFVGEPRRDPCR